MSSSYAPFYVDLLLWAIYLLLVLGLTRLVSRLERRLRQGEKR